MKTKSLLSGILIYLVFSSFTKANSELEIKNTLTKTEKKSGGAAYYQKNYKQFKYYIGSIGFVSIDNVELDNGKLTAVYSYKHGAVIRNVVSILNLDSDGIYKGTCTTKVDGQILFVVNTYLTFSEDGTAIGNWSWTNSPTTNDPIVKVSKS